RRADRMEWEQAEIGRRADRMEWDHAETVRRAGRMEWDQAEIVRRAGRKEWDQAETVRRADRMEWDQAETVRRADRMEWLQAEIDRRADRMDARTRRRPDVLTQGRIVRAERAAQARLSGKNPIVSLSRARITAAAASLYATAPGRCASRIRLRYPSL
ncbi:MAG: hypothetical protein FWE20_05320, partial [Defluviitaleaceae bacterium]|nr:hypothetical protein [Defluviitaleaceae bacterium]